MRQIPKDKVVAAKIGSEQDNYLMYAIRNKNRELVKFMLKNCLGDGEISILDKNNRGMTALHLAISINELELAKLVLIGDHQDEAWVDKALS